MTGPADHAVANVEPTVSENGKDELGAQSTAAPASGAWSVERQLFA